MPRRFLDELPPVEATDLAASADKVPPKPLGPGVPWSPDIAFYQCMHVWGASFPNQSCAASDARSYRRAYRGATSWTDFNVGRLIATLEELKVSETTSVFIFGDHGTACPHIMRM